MLKKFNTIIPLAFLLFCFNANAFYGQRKLSEKELASNFPAYGVYDEKELIYSTQTAYYFLMKNKSDSRTARIYVIHNIEENQDYVELENHLGLAYKVTKKYLDKLEKTLIPIVNEHIPFVDEIRMFHITHDKRLESYSNIFKLQIDDEFPDIDYSIPLTIVLTRYNKGWKHNSYRMHSIIDFNSKNLAEAKRKYEKVKKTEIEPNYSKLQSEYEKVKEKDRLNNEEKELQKIKKYFSENNIPYKEDSFWRSLSNNSNMIKSIYLGDFSNVYIDRYAFKALVISYINHISENCPELLPKNAKELNFNVETSSTNYLYTTYNGGWSFTNYYNNEKKIREVKIKLNPQYENEFLRNQKSFNDDLKLVASQFNTQKLKTFFNNLEGIDDFFNQVSCDKMILKVFGENLFRASQGKKSTPMVLGIFD